MSAPSERLAEGSALKLSGGLLLGGFLLNAMMTMAFHPSGDEDDHPAIFAEYAASDGWVATHLGQFVGVVIALAGLLVLCWVLRSRGVTVLAGLAAAATIITATTFAILQAVDGVALKQAVDAWVDASGADEATRFASAETVRWTEWGVQSYFRVMLGVSVILVGAAILVTRLLASWLGWIAVLAGVVSLAVGIDVGYSGLESGFGDAAGIVSQLLVFVFAIGVLAAAGRDRSPAAAAPD
jgi:hypothetical protein